MLIKIVILGTAFLLVFAAFTFVSYRRLPSAYDEKLVRRIYYLVILVWILVVLVLFKNDIKNFRILNLNNTSAITVTAVNAMVVVLALFAFGVVFEYLFISCKTLKNIRFKNVEITVDDRSKVKYADKFQEKHIDRLYAVLNAKMKMLRYIDYYVEINELDPNESYRDILQEYKNKRQNIELFAYCENAAGIAQMQQELNLTPSEISSIMYCVRLFGFCAPKDFHAKDYIFSCIRTKFLNDDILIALKSDLLIDKEHIVLIDIINYFELVVSLKISEANGLQTAGSVL